MKRNELLILLAGLLMGLGAGIFLYFGLGLGSPTQAGPLGFGGRIPNATGIGAPAPDFELAGLNGETIRLSNLRGKPVLINFWATWCGPCRLEMPAIQARYETYQDELHVLAVDFDEPARDVQAFVDELDLTFDVLLDPGGTVNDLYRVRGYPTTYFIDAEGIIRILHLGSMSEAQLDEYLREMGVGG